MCGGNSTVGSNPTGTATENPRSRGGFLRSWEWLWCSSGARPPSTASDRPSRDRHLLGRAACWGSSRADAPTRLFHERAWRSGGARLRPSRFVASRAPPPAGVAQHLDQCPDVRQGAERDPRTACARLAAAVALGYTPPGATRSTRNVSDAHIYSANGFDQWTRSRE